MKKATSRIWLITLTALALLSLGGCAQEKEENTEENDPQAREAILQCCELIFGMLRLGIQAAREKQALIISV